MQDPNIVGRLQKGDGGALKRVYHTCADRAFSLAIRMTGDASTAQKVVQAVFEELWHKRAGVNPLEDLSSRILRETFVCVRALQSEKGKPLCATPIATSHEVQPLIERLGTLGETEQLVFLLYSADGFTTREVSRTLDITEDAATLLHARALQKLEGEVAAISNS